MKKLIVSAMVAALLAVTFASPVTATDYDPHKPPWAYLMQAGNEDSGDDSGWGEVDDIGPEADSGRWYLLPFSCSYNGVYIIGIIIDFHKQMGEESDYSERHTQPSGGACQQ